MRFLMWLALGFGAACAMGVYLFPYEWLVCACVLSLLLCLCALIAAKWKRIFLIAFAVLLGISLGMGWFRYYSDFRLASAARLDGQKQNACITITDYSYETKYGSAAEGRYQIGESDYAIRVYLDERMNLEPGDVIEGELSFHYTGPKGTSEVSYLQGKGLFLLAYQEGTVETVRAAQMDWRIRSAQWRQRIKEILAASFPEDVFPIAKALLLGDTTDLTYAVDTDLKLSGIRHVVAVSGLHVGIIYSVLMKITARRRFLAVLLGIPVLATFAAIAGFTPSVCRACIMVGLMLLAELFSREYDSATSLAFAGAVMLLVNPLIIASVSFQLSVGCVAGILMFSTPLQQWLKKKFGVDKRPKGGNKFIFRIKSWICSGVCVTISSMSITTPLSAAYFGAVSLVSILTNLLTLWVVSISFVGILLTCMAGLISAQIGAAIGWVVAWPIRYVLLAAKHLSRLPMAAVFTCSVYIVLWLVFAYVLLALFYIFKKKEPMLFLCCGCVALCTALLLSWIEPLRDECRVTVLDVGQGQCILLQSEGKTFLVDCGGERGEEVADRASQMILSQGITGLDGIILTHCDEDHTNGLEFLMSRIDTEFIALPAKEGGFVIPETEAPIIWVDRETDITFADTAITLFPPYEKSSGNEISLCILFETENCDILITGDRNARAERLLLMEYTIPPVDLLIAGHHGSKNSTCTQLLQAVQPETVIISVGEDNHYGHPAPELLQRLREAGCTVYRTDHHGTIIYRR